MTRTLWLLALLGCARKTEIDRPIDNPVDPVVETASGGETATTGVDTLPDPGSLTLNGTVPPQKLSAPEFAARNFDGATRTRPDLLGHPTVMWFFPATDTPG